MWASLAIDQLARGFAGTLAGIPVTGYRIAPERYYTLLVEPGTATRALGPWEVALMSVAGPLAILALALLAAGLVNLLRTGGFLRGLTLAWVVVALLWLPLALLASALPGGGGPVAELYRGLGKPPAGRWTAAALGVALLLVVAGWISRRAVDAGRRWMRADGVDFRRRLVRVTAGWPGVVAVAALALAAGWAAPGWAVGLAVMVLGSLHFRTA